MSTNTAIAKYLLAKVPGNFDGWTLEALEDYVDHHATQGTLSYMGCEKGAIYGVLIGHQQMGTKLLKFKWQKTDPNGDCWWWDHFVADDASIALGLMKDMMQRNPASAFLRCAGFRNGKRRVWKSGEQLMEFKKALNLYEPKS